MSHVDEMQEGSLLRTLGLLHGAEFELDGRRCSLVIPAGVYVPDDWTRTLLRGLLRHLAQRSSAGLVVEVGAGSGAVPIILGLCGLPCRSLRYVGLDVNSVACETARLNVQLNGAALPSEFVSGGYLLERLPAEAYGSVDVLAANLPQVPDVDCEGSKLNDYYRPRARSDGMPQRFELCGTGLLFDLLVASRSVLSSRGALVLTVAGRCGMTELSRLFTYCDMTYHVLHHAVVRQDPNTSIEHFHRTEQVSDIAFTFYADECGQQPISARTAAQALSEGLPVYHDLYAIAARPARPG